MNPLNIGIVGATGMVGETFLQLLAERNFPVGDLKLFASAKSSGTTLTFKERNISVQELSDNAFDGLDLVFFSSGNDISKEWAPRAVAAGAFAIDNSSTFRLSNEVPLIVPEVNAHSLPKKDHPQIIANPNCSTIQMVVALAPLASQFGLRDVKVSTYQSASGAGREAIEELQNQFSQISQKQPLSSAVFPTPLAGNCLPQIGDIEDDGFSTEEKKMIFETRKILGLPELSVSAFAVRVPTFVGHAESIWVSLQKTISKSEFIETLEKSPGLIIQEQPLPEISRVAGTNPVQVGRIHRDLSCDKTWILWVVADNIRKGAALNGLQIAEAIFDIEPAS